MKKVRAVLAYVNGSSTDANVVEMACEVGKRSRSRVHVIYVIQVKRELPLTAEIQPEVDKGERVLGEAERVAEAYGYQIETEILQAREIGPAVVDEAVERSCDLVILGVPFHMRMGSFDVGAAVDYVLKSAPAWVWLIRGPMGEHS
ncbi:MAG: universal stress protein [Chloroflexi bacterium]|nr:universal stress protein [Chloroflexota bacterium]